MEQPGSTFIYRPTLGTALLSLYPVLVCLTILTSGEYHHFTLYLFLAVYILCSYTFVISLYFRPMEIRFLEDHFLIPVMPFYLKKKIFYADVVAYEFSEHRYRDQLEVVLKDGKSLKINLNHVRDEKFRNVFEGAVKVRLPMGKARRFNVRKLLLVLGAIGMLVLLLVLYHQGLVGKSFLSSSTAGVLIFLSLLLFL